MHTDREQQRRVYARLMNGFRTNAEQSADDRWQWLMAAHVVGQMDFRLHVHSHTTMLAFAAQMRDWREAAGQLFRLALVPIGHLAGRLPAGNVGRATVSAFRPMPLSAGIQRLIGDARLALVTETAQGSRESLS